VDGAHDLSAAAVDPFEAYGIDAFKARNPLAWPGMAQPDDVRGLPPVVISVNECDPLRDEGIGFYRLLLESGVSATRTRSVSIRGASSSPAKVAAAT
jgi:acetyl esterase/lipase